MLEKCGATIEFSDNHGDNSITFVCQKQKGHEGLHEIKATTTFNDEDVMQKFTLTWEHDSHSDTNGAYDEEDIKIAEAITHAN